MTAATKTPVDIHLDTSDNRPRNLPVGSSAYVPADTFGWDVVNAVNRQTINSAIKAAQPAALSFQQDLGNGYQISGKFGAFEIVPNGSGENLTFSAAITEGKLEFGGQTYDISPSSVEIEVVLEYVPPIPASPVTPSTSGTDHQLRINGTNRRGQLPPISVLGVSYTGSTKLPSFVSSLAVGALQDWFNSNGDKLASISLATVTLNKEASTYPWLRPTAASYAYLDGDSDQDGVLAVLAMTQGHDSSDLFHNLAPGVIPSGSNSGLLISTPQFVKNAILPGLPQAFVEANVDDFEIVGDGDEIRLKPGKRLQLDPMQVDGEGQYYVVYVESFDLVVENEQIVTSMEAKTNIDLGVDLYVDVKTYQGIKVVRKTDGSLTLGYTETRNTIITHRIHNSTGADIGKVLLTVILSLAGGISGALAKEVAQKIVIFILAAIIKGAVAAAQAIVPDVIEKGVEAAMPPLSDMLAAVNGAVVWAGEDGDQFTVNGARLNGSLQFYGAEAKMLPEPEAMLEMDRAPNTVRVNVTYAVAHSKMEHVQQIADRIVDAAAAAVKVAPSIDKENRLLQLAIQSNDVDAVYAFLDQAGPFFDQLVVTGTARLHRIRVFGDMPDSLRQTLARFSPEFYVEPATS